MMQDVLRPLAGIDFEHEGAIEQLDRSDTDRAAKRQISGRLNERHQQRREPYLGLPTELRTHAVPKPKLHS
jgi:hypothetical protein